jgi:hypothetical protein
MKMVQKVNSVQFGKLTCQHVEMDAQKRLLSAPSDRGCDPISFFTAFSDFRKKL